MYLDAHDPEPLGNASKVDVPSPRHLDLVKTERAMREHDRVAQARLAANARESSSPPKPANEENRTPEEKDERGAGEPRHSLEF